MRDSRADETARGVDLEPGLRGEQLHFWRAERHILRGIDLEVRQGEALQVTGANGAGKTTLLRALSGLCWLEEGRVTWRGRDVRQDMRSYHADMAYVGHESPLKADLTARENLLFWAGLRRDCPAAALDSSLERVGCAQLRDRAVRTLSAGQKRRVALAGLALLGAALWVLDEPTTNLDVEGQRLVASLIDEQLTRGGVVIAAVHHELLVSAKHLRTLHLT